MSTQVLWMLRRELLSSPEPVIVGGRVKTSGSLDPDCETSSFVVLTIDSDSSIE